MNSNPALGCLKLRIALHVTEVDHTESPCVVTVYMLNIICAYHCWHVYNVRMVSVDYDTVSHIASAVSCGFYSH